MNGVEGVTCIIHNRIGQVNPVQSQLLSNILVPTLFPIANTSVDNLQKKYIYSTLHHDDCPWRATTRWGKPLWLCLSNVFGVSLQRGTKTRRAKKKSKVQECQCWAWLLSGRAHRKTPIATTQKNEPFLSVELIQRNAVCEIIPVLESIEARDQAMMNVQLALRNTYPSLAPFVNSFSLAVPPTHASFLYCTLCKHAWGLCFFCLRYEHQQKQETRGAMMLWYATEERKERQKRKTFTGTNHWYCTHCSYVVPATSRSIEGWVHQ